MRKEVADFYDSLIEDYQIELKDPFSEAQQYLDKNNNQLLRNGGIQYDHYAI